MRLRNIIGAQDMIEVNDYVVNEPEQYKGRWNTLFHNENPIHIELGMGKGRFIKELAAANPEINYIGIEKYSSVLIRAVENTSELNLTNLHFLRFDAEYLNNIFGSEEIARIYLNFSDPWPKDRHAKRRLTSRQFLTRYANCLQKDGEVIFKTDNHTLFEFSLEEVKIAKWEVREVTFDLHHSEYLKGNVMTEYEEKFVALGNPIHKMTAYQRK